KPCGSKNSASGGSPEAQEAKKNRGEVLLQKSNTHPVTWPCPPSYTYLAIPTEPVVTPVSNSRPAGQIQPPGNCKGSAHSASASENGAWGTMCTPSGSVFAGRGLSKETKNKTERINVSPFAFEHARRDRKGEEERGKIRKKMERWEESKEGKIRKEGKEEGRRMKREGKRREGWHLATTGAPEMGPVSRPPWPPPQPSEVKHNPDAILNEIKFDTPNLFKPLRTQLISSHTEKCFPIKEDFSWVVSCGCFITQLDNITSASEGNGMATGRVQPGHLWVKIREEEEQQYGRKEGRKEGRKRMVRERGRRGEEKRGKGKRWEKEGKGGKGKGKREEGNEKEEGKNEMGGREYKKKLKVKKENVQCRKEGRKCNAG
ncbi:Cyclic nucleotide-gated cation channel beta-1, partial [Ophiophagus hannah]